MKTTSIAVLSCFLLTLVVPGCASAGKPDSSAYSTRSPESITKTEELLIKASEYIDKLKTQNTELQARNNELQEELRSRRSAEISSPGAHEVLAAREASARKAAIMTVVIQMNKAMVELTNSINEIQRDIVKAALTHEVSEVFEKYHDALVAIDISGCPEDFRVAFVKYYQAVHGFKTYTDSITGWNGVIKGLSNGVASLVNLHDNTDKAVDPLAKAGNELELVCAKYNVDIK